MADVLVACYRDGSGTITFDEFKSVFSAEIGPDAIPFNFDWCVLVVNLGCGELSGRRFQRLGQAPLGEEERRPRSWLYVFFTRLLLQAALMRPTDNEFTQLMKGLQGERLRQAFRYFDENQEGSIRSDQFKRIILVRLPSSLLQLALTNDFSCRNLLGISFRML
jgi:solute carrier family 25 aspartate/glutamate transporter 12/13